jgi:hypothetical protein
MSNVKAGDLAVIIRSAMNNNGRLVEVIGPPSGCTVGCDAYPRDVLTWHCRSIGGPLLGTGGFAARDFVHADSYLRPITPPAGTITQDDVADLYAPSTKETA